MAATQCIWASRCGEDYLLKFKLSIKMGKKGDLNDFERGMVVGAWWAAFSISKTADLLGFSCSTISRVYREWFEKGKISSEWPKIPCWGQWRMGRLVRYDRKATVTQITTRYNQGIQNTISENTTRQTLKQMDYSSRRPYRVPLLSAKNRKRRLQFARAHQNWTREDWKNVAWSDESRFLLQHSDGRVIIWCKEHESIDPLCLVSMVQAGGGGVMFGGYFLGTLLALVPVDLSVSPAPLSYYFSLVQTNEVAHCLTMTYAVWKPCPTLCLTIADDNIQDQHCSCIAGFD